MPRQAITRNRTAVARRATHFAAEIVVIDQAPLRRSVAADCAAAMAQLERARIGWHKFERQDKPAFIRWQAREFGRLLSQARDVEDQLRDAQALVHEVEMEMRRHFQDPRSAYQRVMFRRQNPNATDAHPNEPQTGQPGASPRLSEFEKEALFQDWVQKFLGTHPDKMDDAVYSTTFEVFKSHMFVKPGKEPRLRNVNRGASGPRIQAEIDHAHEHEEDLSAPIDARVKELYRTLVRRLHPDLRADGSAGVSALWHEVQEAYAASDVARLEILLALSDIELNQLGEGTSLSQMHAVLTELNRSSRALEKILMEAQGEDAWDFARTGPDDNLRLRVERQLKSDLAVRSKRLDLFMRTIAAWADAPIAGTRRKRSTPNVQHSTPKSEGAVV